MQQFRYLLAIVKLLLINVGLCDCFRNDNETESLRFPKQNRDAHIEMTPTFNRWRQPGREDSNGNPEDGRGSAIVDADTVAELPVTAPAMNPRRAVAQADAEALAATLGTLPSRLHAIELRAGVSGDSLRNLDQAALGPPRAETPLQPNHSRMHLDQRRHAEPEEKVLADAPAQPKADLLEHLPLKLPHAVDELDPTSMYASGSVEPPTASPSESPRLKESGSFVVSSVDSMRAHQENNLPDEEEPKPALYAVIAALAASLGYIGLVAVRCSGLLTEFTPKSPLKDYIKPRADPVVSSRSRRSRPAARLCCPTRDTLKLNSRQFAGSWTELPETAAKAEIVAQVPPPPTAFSSDSSPL